MLTKIPPERNVGFALIIQLMTADRQGRLFPRPRISAPAISANATHTAERQAQRPDLADPTNTTSVAANIDPRQRRPVDIAALKIRASGRARCLVVTRQI
jgi:hypothetical protein